MKGIILAGGLGSRLHPMTIATSKQLLPIFDKPMIYYPLSVLMEMGITSVLIISTKRDLPKFKELFNSGNQLGISIEYKEQDEPKGIAEAFILGEEFIGNEDVCLILGDNIFHGTHLKKFLQKRLPKKPGATIFGYEVSDPSRYGVIAFDENQIPIEIIEKPANPPSSIAVTGLYFYDCRVCSIAKGLSPSQRGEIEISDINQVYLDQLELNVAIFDRGFAWLDTGTPDALQKAASYIQTIQERQGVKIACLEEIAYQMNYISQAELLDLAESYGSTDYGEYLHKVAKESSYSFVSK